MLTNGSRKPAAPNATAISERRERCLADAEPRLGTASRGCAGPDVLLEELVRRNHAVRRRVGELEATNESLQREIGLEARKLQTIMRELVLAAARTGAQPLARAMRAVASWQSDLLFATNCQPQGGQGCGQCRALAPMAQLSARELEVLRLLTEGSRSPCIASQLGISASTVEVHRRNIMRKLGLHCIADLTKYAVRQGLTPL